MGQSVHFSRHVQTPFDQGVHDANEGLMQETNNPDYLRGYEYGLRANSALSRKSNEPLAACLL